MTANNKGSKETISLFAALTLLCSKQDYFPWCSSETVNFLRP